MSHLPQIAEKQTNKQKIIQHKFWGTLLFQLFLPCRQKNCLNVLYTILPDPEPVLKNALFGCSLTCETKSIY